MRSVTVLTQYQEQGQGHGLPLTSLLRRCRGLRYLRRSRARGAVTSRLRCTQADSSEQILNVFQKRQDWRNPAMAVPRCRHLAPPPARPWCYPPARAGEEKDPAVDPGNCLVSTCEDKYEKAGALLHQAPKGKHDLGKTTSLGSDSGSADVRYKLAMPPARTCTGYCCSTQIFPASSPRAGKVARQDVA